MSCRSPIMSLFLVVVGSAVLGCGGGSGGGAFPPPAPMTAADTFSGEVAPSDPGGLGATASGGYVYRGVSFSGECVAACRRYYQAQPQYAFTLPFLGANAGAFNFWEVVQPEPSDMTRVARTATNTPQPDDMIVYSAWTKNTDPAQPPFTTNPYGHVGVVVSVTGRVVRLVDSNWVGRSAGGEHDESLDDPRILGWYRPIVKTIGALTPPAAVSASLIGSAVGRVSWSAVPGATRYDVYWGTAPGVTKGSNRLPPTTTTAFDHSGLSGGSSYYYAVAAANASTESGLSSEVHVDVPGMPTALPPLPGGPSTTTALASLTRPASVVLKGTSTAYFVRRTADGQILKWDLPSNTPSVVVTGLALPTSLAMDGDLLYVADWGNNLVKRIDTSLAHHPVSIFAGDGTPAFTAGTTSPTGTGMQPHSLAVDPATHDVFISEFSSSRILKINRLGVLSVVAGSGPNGNSGDGGQATSATLSFPSSLCRIGGSLYFKNSNYLRKIDLNSGVIESQPLVLPSGASGTFDGELTPDGSGGLFLTQQGEHRVWRVSLPSGLMTLVAGTGAAGGLDGSPLSATFDHPFSLVVHGPQLLVCETDAHRIRAVPW